MGAAPTGCRALDERLQHQGSHASQGSSYMALYIRAGAGRVEPSPVVAQYMPWLRGAVLTSSNHPRILGKQCGIAHAAVG